MPSDDSKKFFMENNHENESNTDSTDRKNDTSVNFKSDEAEDARDEGVKAQDADELKAKLDAALKESADHYERLLRVSAEFENFKKRSAREMAEYQKFANQSLVKDLLPIIDNLELALKSANKTANSADECLIDGVELTRKEILKVLENYSVQQIEALGKAFDPNFHEAVMREESDDYPENTVVNEMQKGYLMHDRLIRPSMVVVSMPQKKGSD